MFTKNLKAYPQFTEQINLSLQFAYGNKFKILIILN